MLNQHEKLLIIDFGGPEKTVVARAVRGSKVYSEVHGPAIKKAEVLEQGYKGIILCGTPVEGMNLHLNPELLSLDLPILAFGYGGRSLLSLEGGQMKEVPARKTEELNVKQATDLLMGIEEAAFSHLAKEVVATLPEGYKSYAGTSETEHLLVGNEAKKRYVLDAPARFDEAVLKLFIGNFLCMFCHFSGDWDMASYMLSAIDELKRRCEGKRALLALSGGVDSSVVAALAHKALGPRLHAVFVDHGLMRKNEGDAIEHVFREKMGLNLVRVNAEERFLKKLKGVSDPEKKRKIIGEEFIRVFEEEARKANDLDFLLQGTIYPDVIESGIGGHMVKSHHNVGGLPEDIRFEDVLEPLRPLYKDEVRELGLLLGLPEEVVRRQPFPGPGLGVRCLGEVKKEKLDLLREADFIFRDEIKKAGLEYKIGQYFAVITENKSVGTSKTGERTYEETIALRAVQTGDFMTASFTKLPWELLEHAAERILNEVEGVGRVVYDISSKPPATIEWE